MRRDPNTDADRAGLVVSGKPCRQTESRKHTITLLVIKLACVKLSLAGSNGAYAMTLKTITMISHRLLFLGSQRNIIELGNLKGDNLREQTKIKRILIVLKLS